MKKQAGGVALPLGDDTTVALPLGFSFPFLGKSYSSIFANSDGNITFGGDSAALPRGAARTRREASRV